MKRILSLFFNIAVCLTAMFTFNACSDDNSGGEAIIQTIWDGTFQGESLTMTVDNDTVKDAVVVTQAVIEKDILNIKISNFPNVSKDVYLQTPLTERRTETDSIYTSSTGKKYLYNIGLYNLRTENMSCKMTFTTLP